MSAIVVRRLMLPLQRRGNLGKSMLIAALAQYYDHHAISWQGFDLDPEHRSFSRLFPEQATLRELSDEPEAEVVKIARACASSPVTLVDPRAHLSDALLRGFEMIRFPEEFAKEGGRMTVPLFPADDLEVLTDIDGLVGRLGNRVDYIIVRNPARQPRTRMFTGSELESDISRLGANSVEMPPLLALARNHLAALESDLGRGVTHVEAVANANLNLDGMMRLILEDWLRTTFRRFDSISTSLLPTADAAKIVQVDAGATGRAPHPTRGAKINRSNL